MTVEGRVFVDVRSLERARLLVWELVRLRDDMDLVGNPMADRLDSILDRFGVEIDGDRKDAE